MPELSYRFVETGFWFERTKKPDWIQLAIKRGQFTRETQRSATRFNGRVVLTGDYFVIKDGAIEHLSAISYVNKQKRESK